MESITVVQQTETSKTAIATKSRPPSMISRAALGSSGSGGLGDTSQATEKTTVQPGQARQEECKSNKTPRRKSTAQKVDSFCRFWKPIFRVLACMLWLGKRPLDKKSSSKSLSTYFFSLPTELQLEIVNQLSIHEIIHLRQTSRAFSLLIQSHESHIVKQHIKTWMPKYISILFPLPTTEPATLEFLGNVTYRREVSDSLAEALAQRIVREMGKGRPQKPPVSPKVLEYVVEKLKLGFSPLILAIFHFLETYHRRKSQELSGTGPFNESTLEDQELEIQSNIMLQYPDSLLLRIHQMFHLLLHLLTRRLGNLYWYSKRIGMWHGAPSVGRPNDEDLAKLLLLGGIPEIARLLKLKGRAKRRREFHKYLKKVDSRGQSEAPTKYHGGTVMEGLSINIDKLSRIWVPAAEKQLLSRGIVKNLANIRCCGEFVAELLGEEFTSVAESSILDENENADDTAGQSAQLIAAMNFGHSHLRFADDGSWDQNLIVDGEDEDEDYLEAIEAKGKEGHGEKRPPTPPSKSVAGPSKSPGTIVGMTAPVPGCSGSGYNGMGANFMSMAL